MLPDKPSELIRLAIKDLNLSKIDPMSVIDMSTWYEIRHNSHETPSQKCHHCLAGAIMKYELFDDEPKYGTDDGESTEIGPCDFDNSIRTKLITLNQFRLGQIEQPMKEYFSRFPSKIKDRKIITYRNENHDEFCRQMLQLADDFEAEGN